MGLSIHYSGYVFNKEMLDPLIEEVTDICKTLGWSTHSFDDEDIKGVSFAPKGSESIFLTFNHEGRTLSPINLMAKDIYGNYGIEKDLIFTASTKTQYAGADAHIAIIKLLKYLSKKYLKDFTLIDEGYYWETDDEKILLEQFEKYNAAIDIFCEALKGLPAIPGETAESLGDRLERLLREKLGGKKE
jgi:DNA helicase HerA-like ATPase